MKTLPNVFALILILFASACALPLDHGTDSTDMDPRQQAQAAEGNEAFRWGTRAENWGQGRQLGFGEIAEDQPVALGNIDAPTIWRVPKVQNIALFAEQNVITSGNLMLRWQLQAGIGGGSSLLEFDALRFQQVAISAASVRIALVARRLNPSIPITFDPDMVINAGYYQADGNTSTNLARFSTIFQAPNGVNRQIPVPNGASAFQVFGDTSLVNVAGVKYEVVQDFVLLDSYKGTELLASHAAGDFIPLVGVADKIIAANTSGVEIDGIICFQLEL